MPVRWDALPRLGREEARLLDAVARRLPAGPPPGPEAREAIESVLGQTFGAEGVEIVPGAVAAMTFGEFVGGSRTGVNVRLTLGTGEAAAAWIESELAHRVTEIADHRNVLRSQIADLAEMRAHLERERRQEPAVHQI